MTANDELADKCPNGESSNSVFRGNGWLFLLAGLLVLLILLDAVVLGVILVRRHEDGVASDDHSQQIVPVPVSVTPQQETPVESPNEVFEPHWDEPEELDSSVVDWDRRYADLCDFCRSRFSPPQVGRPISMRLQSGGSVEGTLVFLDNNKVEVRLSSGGTVGFQREALDAASRVILFCDDFVEYHATRKLREEKALND